MERAKATPEMFGLAVRSHPSALLVTARNKMGSGEKHVMIGLSNNFVETTKLSADPGSLDRNRRAALRRSEEHTSELQSLMRISYAVFCLKKKNKRRSTVRRQQLSHSPIAST